MVRGTSDSLGRRVPVHRCEGVRHGDTQSAECFLALVLIRSGVGHLCFTGMSEGARRMVGELICDSDLELIAVGSWERVRVMEAPSRMTLRGPREPSQRQFSV